MTRCADFYRKWQRAHNFCDAQYHTVRNIDNYLEVVERLEEEYKIPQDLTFVNFSENAARILNEKKNSEYKEHALPVIAQRILMGDGISNADMIDIINEFKEAVVGEKSVYAVPFTEDALTWGLFSFLHSDGEKWWPLFVGALKTRCTRCGAYEGCNVFFVKYCLHCGEMAECEDAKELVKYDNGKSFGFERGEATL